MTDGTLLMQAILRNPEEDTTRLIYADWLDEGGEREYAEFIRKQIAGKPYGKRPSQNLLRAVIGEAVSRRGYVDNGILVKHLDCSGYASATIRVRGRSTVPMGSTRRIWGARTRSTLSIQRGIPFHWKCSPCEFRDTAAIVFASCPIVEVILDNKCPFHEPSLGYCWVQGDWSEGRVEYQRQLPPEMFDRLPGTPIQVAGDVLQVYPNSSDAYKALAVALLTWGRALASFKCETDDLE